MEKTMKIATWATRVITIILALGLLTPLFFSVVTIATSSQGVYSASLFQLAFGDKLTSTTGNAVSIYKSLKALFTGLMILLSAGLCVWSGVRKPSKGYRPAVASLVFGIVDLVMVIYFATKTAATMADYRPIAAAKVEYTSMFTLMLWLTVAYVVMSIVRILVEDYYLVLVSSGAKKPIFKRIITWLGEYKSEIKKITWPKMPAVIKNTVIVLVCCVVVGVVIWLADYGLGLLVKTVFKS